MVVTGGFLGAVNSREKQGNCFVALTYLQLKPIDLGAIVAIGRTLSDGLALDVRLSQSAIPISERPEQPVQRWNNFMMNMALQWMVTWSFG